MSKLLRYIINTILFIVFWSIMFLPVAKFYFDTDSTSTAIVSLGGIVALIISFALVKRINKSNLWSRLFSFQEVSNEEAVTSNTGSQNNQVVHRRENILSKVFSKGWLRLHIVISLLGGVPIMFFNRYAFCDSTPNFSDENGFILILWPLAYWLLILLYSKVMLLSYNIISKAWLRNHFLIAIFISFTAMMCVGVTSSHYSEAPIKAFCFGAGTFVLYYLVLLVVVWVINGFKKDIRD